MVIYYEQPFDFVELTLRDDDGNDITTLHAEPEPGPDDVKGCSQLWADFTFNYCNAGAGGAGGDGGT